MAGSARSGVKKKNFSDLQQNLSTHVLKILLRRCDRKGRSCEESMSKNAKFYFGMLIIMVLVIYQEFLSPLFKLQGSFIFLVCGFGVKVWCLDIGIGRRFWMATCDVRLGWFNLHCCSNWYLDLRSLFYEVKYNI